MVSYLFYKFLGVALHCGLKSEMLDTLERTGRLPSSDQHVWSIHMVSLLFKLVASKLLVNNYPAKSRGISSDT